MTKQELVERSKANFDGFNQTFNSEDFSEERWADVRRSIRATGLSVVQYRQLWRRWHPNGRVV